MDYELWIINYARQNESFRLSRLLIAFGQEFLNSKDCDYSCYQNPLHAVIAGTMDAAVRTGHAGHPERIILSGLAKAGYALFLPLTRFCRIFCYHTHFQYHVIILAAPPPTP